MRVPVFWDTSALFPFRGQEWAAHLHNCNAGDASGIRPSYGESSPGRGSGLFRNWYQCVIFFVLWILHRYERGSLPKPIFHVPAS
jgi:hypothetical protein